MVIGLRRPLRDRAASILKSNVSFNESPARIMPHFFARDNGFCGPPSRTVNPATAHCGGRYTLQQQFLIDQAAHGRQLPNGPGAPANTATAQRKEGGGDVYEKSLEMRRLRIFPYPEQPEGAFPGRREAVGKNIREKGSVGGGWMYNSS